MSRQLLTSLGLSLALTLLFESLFFFIVGKRSKWDWLLLLLLNVLTNPVVVMSWYLLRAFTKLNLLLVLVFLETAAVVVEGCFYRKYAETIKRPFCFSLAANACSFGAGKLIEVLF
ncbi:MAG: hypothetical protein GX681_07600 [Clostridiaceae bacterium]|nr:hypothetical protein [Clostridiaceae bacterium]